MDKWINYFISTAGVAAGLTGLIFVGLSVNVKKIFCISKAHLPSRALGSLIVLTNIVITSNLCLVPKQPIYGLGVEVLIAGAIIWIIITRLDLIMYRTVEGHYRPQYFRNIFYSQFTIMPFLIAGVFLLYNLQIGVYLLVPGIIFSLVKSMVDIWFIMVDINR
jgi:hypothetical protein